MQDNNFTLPKTFAKQWLQELRSGKYEQTVTQLHDGNGYCCLGVAGCLVGLTKEEMLGESSFDDMLVDSGKLNKVPEELICTPLSVKLINLNDSEYKTFNQIADWIETNVTLV